ncbi:MAG: rhodanese-like domain-containing protein, partial [Acidobacteria bacterium]|nr:rhodanese-like domain-containing protein [Acidobacteriota bacterium]
TLSGPASCRRENSRTRDASEKRTPSQGNEEAGTKNEGDPFAAIPRIKVSKLVEAIKEGRAVVVDIRVAEAYDEEHIKGAVSIPLEEVRERGPKELPPDKLIVTYCA